MVLVVAVFLLLLQPPAQAPPRDARLSPPPGTAILRGIVVDEPTGAPIAGARVIAARDQDAGRESFRAMATADHAGRFEFTSLPPGGFLISAGAQEFRATHISTTLRPEGANPLIGRPSFTLAAGEVRENVRIALERALAVEGRVVNEFGEPMAEVVVSATHDNGLIGTSEVTTDDRGLYRLFGLPGGQYTVCALPSIDRQVRGSRGDGLRARYDRVCAAPVTVTQSTAVPRVEIQMQRVSAFMLSGSVLSVTGRPPNNLRVQIIPKRRHSGSGNIPTEVGGSQFIGRGLVSGEYTVIAMDIGTGPVPGGDMERGTMNIRVDAGDVTGVVLTTSPPASIQGRIDTAAGAPALPLGKITVRLVPPLGERGDLSSDLSNVVAADRTFRMSGIFGPQVVVTTGLAPGWFVDSVVHGGEDIADQPREFRAGDAREVVVIVSNRAATLRVRPVDGAGKPRGDAFLMLVPADPKRWRAPPIGSMQPDQDEEGFWELTGRRPGEYFVAAVPISQMRLSPVFGQPVESFARVGRRIRLIEGQTLTIDLPITPLENAR